MLLYGSHKWDVRVDSWDSLSIFSYETAEHHVLLHSDSWKQCSLLLPLFSPPPFISPSFPLCFYPSSFVFASIFQPIIASYQSTSPLNNTWEQVGPRLTIHTNSEAHFDLCRKKDFTLSILLENMYDVLYGRTSHGTLSLGKAIPHLSIPHFAFYA